MHVKYYFHSGKDAMEMMTKFSVFISGMKGLKSEVPKNVILSGVKSVTLHDTEDHGVPGSPVLLKGCQYGDEHTASCYQSAAELNIYVTMRHETGTITDEMVKDHSVVVMTNSSLEEQL